MEDGLETEVTVNIHSDRNRETFTVGVFLLFLCVMFGCGINYLLFIALWPLGFVVLGIVITALAWIYASLNPKEAEFWVQ